jgi:Cu+-exporting ATPase
VGRAEATAKRPASVVCHHCGTACGETAFTAAGKSFCCHGCQTVFELLAENGLGQFYELSADAGRRIENPADAEKYRFLDEPSVRARLVDFDDGKTTRVTLHLPAIHCVACVWLLENLFRLKPGIGQSRVNFARQEAIISFDPQQVELSAVAALLESIGYEPNLKLADLEGKRSSPVSRRLWLQLGVAGFVFGNTMLFSLPAYFGLDSLSGPTFRSLVGWLSLGLGVPVIVYSAADFFRNSWLSFQQRRMTIDVPIAVGIAVIFLQSAAEVISGRGEGYFDSLAGLTFFLLCGRVFQQKTYDRLAFDRDYRSFFPLSVIRIRDGGVSVELARPHPSPLPRGEGAARMAELTPQASLTRTASRPAESKSLTGEIARRNDILPLPEGEGRGEGEPNAVRNRRAVFPTESVRPSSESLLTSAAMAQVEERVSLGQIGIGDRLVIRHGELIPADARVLGGEALIDYSFVTGESEPLAKAAGELLYAGGRQTGGALEVVTVKPVSQSYLTSLWNQDAFRKQKDDTFNTLTNRYSQRFTWIILGIALAAATFWAFVEPARALRSFTGVLIVACPCALALAAPFTLGAALRALARRNIFVRNTDALEALARVNTVVFDKTGTLTAAHGGKIVFTGAELSPDDATAIAVVARQSTHPLSRRLADELAAGRNTLPAVAEFREVAGHGVEARVNGRKIQLGSRRWLEGAGVAIPPEVGTAGSTVWVAIAGEFRGVFTLGSALRPETDRLLKALAERHEIALLSGDNERDRQRFAGLFGPKAHLQFNQSPLNKLGFIRDLQQSGRTVMMVGDGLNDAGALRQSDVGVAVVEQVGSFSPASDVIMDATLVPRTAELLRFARQATLVVRLSFLISTLYNVVGLTIAASGNLAPVVCAILMPVSSVTVVAFAVGLTRWLGRRAGLEVTIAAHSTPKEGEPA